MTSKPQPQFSPFLFFKGTLSLISYVCGTVVEFCQDNVVGFLFVCSYVFFHCGRIFNVSTIVTKKRDLFSPPLPPLPFERLHTQRNILRREKEDEEGGEAYSLTGESNPPPLDAAPLQGVMPKQSVPDDS